MINKIRGFILWTLNGRVNPLAYLTAYASLAIGFFFSFFISLGDVQNSLLYKSDIMGAPGVWGLLMLVSSIILVIGIRFGLRQLTMAGAMGNFILWGFAAITYLHHEYWYLLFSLAMFHLLCQGYLYLAAALDTLWDFN